MSLYRPQMMHNGKVIEMEGDIIHALRFGYSPLGWEGDTSLSLAYNRESDRIELWREEDDGELRLVIRSKPGTRTVDMDLIKFLVTHDRNRGHNVEEEIDTHNDKVMAEHEATANERVTEATAKVASALRKDFGIKY